MDNDIEDEGAEALAALTGLTNLNLSFNWIGAGGGRALAALTGLDSLDLGWNTIGDEGARALVALTRLRKAFILRVMRSPEGPAAAGAGQFGGNRSFKMQRP